MDTSLITGEVDGGAGFSVESLSLQTTDASVDHVDFLIDGSVVATDNTGPFCG